MQLVFSNHTAPLTINSSIFLAGPTPRSLDIVDWRREAVKILEELNYTGVVYIPCPDFVWNKNSNFAENWDYDSQVLWEMKHRSLADKIVFWVPRDINGGMPAFTTNIEFGEDLDSQKMIYGRPNNAEKCKYMDKRVEGNNMPVFVELEAMLKYAVDKLGQGSLRVNGETNVPLIVWNTPQFQGWYSNLKEAGNALVDAQVLKVHVIKEKVFGFSLWVNVWVGAEGRMKENEILFARPDISTIVAYHRGKEDRVVLIKEFRSNVNNKSGYIYELPGGSNLNSPGNTATLAQHEFFEETGVFIKDVSRFKHVATKQMAATFTIFKNAVYSLELSDEEFEVLKKAEKEGTIFGEDSEERTQVVIKTVKDLMKEDVDFSMIGSIIVALQK